MMVAHEGNKGRLMMGNEESQKTEQATETQNAEPAAPSGIGEALAMFRKEQAENKPSEGNDKSQETKEGESKETETQGKDNEASGEAEDGKGDGESKESPFRLVDAEGKPATFPITVDGKEEILDISKPEDLNKLKTWAQLGKYGTKRNEELNEREKAIKDAEAMLSEIKGAVKDGRLVVNPPSSGEKKVEPSDEEKALQTELKELEEIDDPELRKERGERLKLQQELGKQKKEFSALKELVTGKFIEEMYGTMDKQIKELTAEKYPYAKEKDVWNLLAEKENGAPKYKTIEEAIKKSHDEEKVRVRDFIEKDPELKEKSEEDKQAIIAQYLKDKAEKEKAPVSSPSDTTADAKSGGKKEEEITGIASAMEGFKKWQKGHKEAGANI